MAERRGSGSEGAHPGERPTSPGKAPGKDAFRAAPEGVPPGLPDVARKMIALGLSSVFATQETLRQVLGDALPKEWVDFAADQSERTRTEFLERLAGELARTLESIDLAQVMQQALEGRTLEVHARIRMLPDEEGGGFRLSMKEDDRG